MQGLNQTPTQWAGSGWVLLDESVDPHGIVGVGGALTVERLRKAYQLGIFPWPDDDELLWFCPPRRGIIDFEHLHVPRRFQKDWRKTMFDYTINQAFPQVIEECARARRRDQSGTWITQELIDVYQDFHRAGDVQSFEVWRSGHLVAGLYGVRGPRVFAGESAFGTESNASKHALMWCLQNLIQSGDLWMDIQMVTPLTEQFGGIYIPRDQFLRRVLDARRSDSSV